MSDTRGRLPLLPVCLAQVPATLRTALDQQGIAHCAQSPERPAGRFVLFDSRSQRTPLLADGQWQVDVSTLAGDLPFDPWEALADEHAACCRWQVGPYSIREEVARINKRQIRRQLMARLRRRLEELGGVWLCVSPYPFPYQSAFNLRIDHDEYDAQDFASLLKAIAGREDACSHYVCAAGFQSDTHVLDALRGQHVGAHGYHHHTYQSTEENRRNIARGSEFLRGCRLDPVGFVSPHGRFNRHLLAALDALRVTHSSEFGLVYDELPLLPAGSDVLQIPVHPVCLGLFLEAARRTGHDEHEAAREAAEYFRRLIDQRYQRGEPVFVYGHPTGRWGRYPQVVQAIFESADACGALWRTPLSRFADWWRARRQVRLRVLADGDGRYAIHVDEAAGNYRLAAEYWRGQHVALMPLDEPVMRFVPGDLAYQSRRAAKPPSPVRVDGSHGLRAGLRRWLDWERVTPVDEIRADSVRGWMKRTLRRIKP